MVEGAARDGTLIPITGLTGQFPTSAQQFFQAYAESVSAVDFLIRTHGQDALVSLIRSYADGRTDDEAFTAAIGMDMTAFDAAWMADLGAETPVRYGPQPAAAGPEPDAWAGAGGPTASGAPGPGAVGRLPAGRRRDRTGRGRPWRRRPTMAVPRPIVAASCCWSSSSWRSSRGSCAGGVDAEPAP